MLATLQLRTRRRRADGDLPPRRPAAGCRRRGARPGRPVHRWAPTTTRGPTTTSGPRTRRGRAGVLDRHGPGHQRRVRSVRRPTAATTTRAGGPRSGWALAAGGRAAHPQFWARDGGGWLRRRFGVVEPLPAASRCSTCAGTRPTPTRAGPASGCPPRPSGRRRRRWDPRTGPSAGTPGATTPDEPGRPTSGSGTPARRRRRLPARCVAATASSRCSATCGSGRQRLPPPTPASARSPTASTARCSSAPTTRCCAAGRGRPTRRPCAPRSATGTTRSAGRSSPASAAPGTPRRATEQQPMCRHLAYLGPPPPCTTWSGHRSTRWSTGVRAPASAPRPDQRRRLRRGLVRPRPCRAGPLPAGGPIWSDASFASVAQATTSGCVAGGDTVRHRRDARRGVGTAPFTGGRCCSATTAGRRASAARKALLPEVPPDCPEAYAPVDSALLFGLTVAGVQAGRDLPGALAHHRRGRPAAQ